MSLRTMLWAACLAALLVSNVFAAADDYAFEAVQAEIEKGDGVTVAVRLVERATNRPVPDAVIIATRRGIIVLLALARSRIFWSTYAATLLTCVSLFSLVTLNACPNTSIS